MGFEVFDDYECEGQLSLFNEEKSPILVAESKLFANAIKQMNLTEWKAFINALTKIKFSEKNNNIVNVDKWELVENIGIKTDKDHLNGHLRQALGKMANHSFISIELDNGEGLESGNFLSRVSFRKDSTYVRFKFEEDYMVLFEELGEGRPFITLWCDDIYQMKSERSILFYEDLRLHSDTRKLNTRIYGIRDLKTLFEIPKDGEGSYMRKDGHFDRGAFEKRVIDPLCQDLKSCSMISLHLNEDGRAWRKIKDAHGRVRGYEFSWTISERPQIANAKEMAEIKETLSLEELKVAKDIVKGRKKPKPEKKNNFNNFNERDYDYDDLLKDIKSNGGLI